MMRHVRSLVMAAGGVLIACARPHTGSQDSASLSGDTTTLVMLDRGACHGTCPIYAVRLAANGQVRFVGARFVSPMGVDSARVPASEVEKLRTAFADRKFAAVPSAIEFGTKHCGRYVADLSTVELTVRVASVEHRVRYDQGCGDHPRMLDTLADMIDSVSGAARWTTVARP